MKKYLKELSDNPNQDNLEKVKHEITRAEIVLKHYNEELTRLTLDGKVIEEKFISIKNNIDYEENYIKEATEVRNKIAITLIG